MLLRSTRQLQLVCHSSIRCPSIVLSVANEMVRSAKFRYYIAVIVCMAVFLCNFLAAGPTVAIVDITIDFFGPPGPTFVSHISRVAYFFTTTALMQGMSNILWMPIILKFGRRPVYLTAFTFYTGCAIWAGVAKSYSNELAARILMGLASGAGECVAPITIADIFFLHERGTVMA
jgi:MFS family permease